MGSAYPFEITESTKRSLEGWYVDNDHVPPWTRYGHSLLRENDHLPHHLYCLEDWCNTIVQCHETFKTLVSEIDDAVSSSHLPDVDKSMFNGILSGLDTTTDYMGRLLEDVRGLLHWSAATWEHDPVIHPQVDNGIYDISVWVEEYFEWHNVGNQTTVNL